jgi:hypothetical protein
MSCIHATLLEPQKVACAKRGLTVHIDVCQLCTDRDETVSSQPETSVAPLVSVTVTGFIGKNPPNGTWTMKMPNPEGTIFGKFLVKLTSENQQTNLEIFSCCCGGRLKLSAKGVITQPGSTFEVSGSGDFLNQKGFGTVS